MARRVETEEWVRALAAAAPAPVLWDRAVLAAIGISLPVALGLLLAPHDSSAVALGSLAAMGALSGSIMDTGAAGAERIHRMGVVSAAASVGFAIGTSVYGHAVGTLLAAVIAAFVSGVAGTISATASKAGLYFLVFTVTAANADFGLPAPWVAPLLFFFGAVWRLLLTTIVTGMTGVTLSPERRAVAQVYDAIADEIDRAAEPIAGAASARLTTVLDGAYEALAGARTAVAARDARWQDLVAVLNASTPVIDATIALADRGTETDTAQSMYVRRVAAWIRDPATEPPAVPAADGTSSEAVALSSSLDCIGRVMSHVTLGGRWARGSDQRPFLPAVETLRGRLRYARTLMAGADTWFAVLRLVLCMAIAQTLSFALDLQHPYLVMLTVAQVMKPDLGSVFARAVQRAGGTILGIVAASAVIVLVTPAPWQILVIALLAGLVPITMPRNYGLYSGVSMCLAVLLVELHAGASTQLVEDRLFDALIGCLIVLVAGYLPWPSTWRAPLRLAAQVSELARSVAEYATVALSDAQQRPESRDPAVLVEASDARAASRRDVYRRIADLRVRLTRSLAEPPAISSVAASWSPEIAALERVADAVTATATTAPLSGALLDERDISRIHDVLEDIADAIAAGRVPAQPVPLTAAPLVDVSDAVVAACAALSSRVRRSDALGR